MPQIWSPKLLGELQVGASLALISLVMAIVSLSSVLGINLAYLLVA